eukprot:COSAG01_NODE_2208_length_8166_cov_2.677823_1_plen_179_part_00
MLMTSDSEQVQRLGRGHTDRACDRRLLGLRDRRGHHPALRLLRRRRRRAGLPAAELRAVRAPPSPITMSGCFITLRLCAHSKATSVLAVWTTEDPWCAELGPGVHSEIGTRRQLRRTLLRTRQLSKSARGRRSGTMRTSCDKTTRLCDWKVSPDVGGSLSIALEMRVPQYIHCGLCAS